MKPNLKKAAYEEWGLKERHGLEFDVGKIFCFRFPQFYESVVKMQLKYRKQG